MTQLATAIHDSLQLSLGYARGLLKDVTPDQFARFGSIGDQTIVSNHGAFIFGHLALYPPKILAQLGEDPVAIPAGFEAVFSKDANCQDDPDGTIYPAMDDIVNSFFTGYEAAGAAVLAAGDKLQQPNPTGGRLTEKFPTLGSMQNFYVGGHIMMHMGQMSAWRRMIGLGAA